MIKYRLKKNLPCAKAGEIFREDFDENNIVYLYQESYGIKQHKICLEDIDNFDEWFEEDVKIYFTIDFFRKEIAKVSEKEIMGYAIDNVKSLGLSFETKEEAEKYLEYLKAQEIIRRDAKGFKPNWNDNSEIKYFGYLHFEKIEFGSIAKKNKFGRERMNKTTTIYFKSEKDIKESFKNHPKEWKTYLTYEQ